VFIAVVGGKKRERVELAAAVLHEKIDAITKERVDRDLVLVFRRGKVGQDELDHQRALGCQEHHLAPAVLYTKGNVHNATVTNTTY
jgi:hypothetical protein